MTELEEKNQELLRRRMDEQTNKPNELFHLGDAISRLKSLAEIAPKPALDTREYGIQKQRNKRIETLRSVWNAPRRHVQATGIDRSGKWGEAERKLLNRIGTGYMVALIGIRGSGKTQLGIEIMRATTERLKSALYCTATGFFLDLTPDARKESGRCEKSIINDYAKPSLLVIDEFGKRGDSDWETRLLFHLLDRRYLDCKDTILIANQTREEFEKTVGPSIASRMSETGGIYECNWESYRTRKV